MLGIRLMRLLDVLTVTSAVNADGFQPRTLLVSVDKIEVLDQVLVNGVASPTVIPLDDTRLLVEVPGILATSVITDITVLSAAASMTRRSMIEFGVGARVAALSGKQRLLQTFIRILLRSGGSNIFRPQLGGGVLQSIGQNLSGRAKADISIAISNVRRQIMAAQAPETGIPPEERLLSAELVSCSEDVDNNVVYATVLLTAHDRQQAAATFVA